MPDQQALQTPSLLVETRKTHQFALKHFPRRHGKQQKTMIAVHRDDELAATGFFQAITVLGRHSHTAFSIQIQCADPAKQAISPQEIPQLPTSTHFMTL